MDCAATAVETGQGADVVLSWFQSLRWVVVFLLPCSYGVRGWVGLWWGDEVVVFREILGFSGWVSSLLLVFFFRLGLLPAFLLPPAATSVTKALLRRAVDGVGRKVVVVRVECKSPGWVLALFFSFLLIIVQCLFLSLTPLSLVHLYHPFTWLPYCMEPRWILILSHSPLSQLTSSVFSLSRHLWCLWLSDITCKLILAHI